MNVQLVTKDSLAILTLGTPEERVVILNDVRMDSLRKTLEELGKRTDLRGLIIAGPHAEMFCAGADVHVIQSVQDASHGTKLAQEGQEIFDLIQNLPFPSVAAISGPCAGGGFEMSLACTYRIAAIGSQTRIGLPEVRLGILPGFGGTQRLPKLVGIRTALDIILKGRLYSAEDAKKRGMVDLLVREPDPSKRYETLLKTAEEILRSVKGIERREIPLMEKILSSTALGRRFVEGKAKSAILSETHGHYPAPLKAIECVCASYEKKNGYLIEREALGEMIVTPVCKSLVHLHFISEESQKVGKPLKKDVDTWKVGVLGGGVMGSGIAASLLLSGLNVILVEPVTEARTRAENFIRGILEKKRGISPYEREEYMRKIVISEKLEALEHANCIIEAIVEDIGVKKEIFGKLEHLVSPETILASNTSSLSITEIAEDLQHPERVVGIHFFNPAEKMPLVEIVRGKKTGDRFLVRSAALVVKLSKYPIIVEDVPGFLVNRILTPYLLEASYLLAEGHSIEVIDQAAVKFGLPMGPLRLLDEIGLDVASKVSLILGEAYGERMQGHEFSQLLLSAGRKGKKSGSGFYRYDGKSPIVDSEVKNILKLPGSPKVSLTTEEIALRLIAPVQNEALRAFDERVAGYPGPEAASQIDLGSVMGFGFPPFRGGVFHHTHLEKLPNVYERLKEYSKRYGGRFEPAPGFEERLKLGKQLFEAVELDHIKS
jgi:3-hydroxyacyl-CoA dehydrogenase / enoyl-CoA hydratase / 3-hydroxybutyryl-CoA epimerase